VDYQSPINMNLSINELVQILEEYDIKVKLLADDVKLLKLLDNHDLEKLQGAFNSLVKWSDTSYMAAYYFD